MRTNLKILSALLAGAVSGYVSRLYIGEKAADIEYEERKSDRYLRGAEILKYGAPERFPEKVVYKNHVLHYDQSKKIPLWVAEHITSHHVEGPANRRHSKFRPDPIVPEPFSAQNEDYLGSGWSRGHMAPAGNNKFDQEAMNESFYLTNILPQDWKNNGDFWNRLEIYCRDLTKKYANVRIISGPLMLSEFDETGKKYIMYQVIGQNEVAVPTHLYKIILVESDDGRPEALGSFVIPNKDIPKHHSLSKYQVPLEFIEKRSGFKFWPKLLKKDIKDLCVVDECRLITPEELQLYIIRRKLVAAKTIKALEKAWNELDGKNLKPSPDIENLYNTKKEELANKEL